MGNCSCLSSNGLTIAERRQLKEYEGYVYSKLKQLQEIVKELDAANHDFFMDAQLSDMSMSIKQIPQLIKLAIKVVNQQNDPDAKRLLYSSLRTYSQKLLVYQKQLPELFSQANKTMEQHHKMYTKNKPTSTRYKYPDMFDRVRCLEIKLKVVAYDLEVPEILLKDEKSVQSSAKLTDEEQARLNTRLQSVINCLVVSVKLN